MNGDRDWERLAPLSGLVFVVLLVVSTFMVPRLPAADAGGQDIAAFFAGHRSGGLTASYLMGLGAIFALVFFAVLFVALRRAEGERAHLAVMALIAAAATVVVVMTADAIRTSLYLRTGQEGDPGVVRALYDVSSALLHFASFLLALFLAAASAVMIRTGAIARGLGWAGVLFAAVQLIAAGGVVTDTSLGSTSLVALLTFALWIALVSILMASARPR